MEDPEFSTKLYGNNFYNYYNLKTEPTPQEESEQSQKSLLIHEDEVSQAEIATFVIKGIDELDIPQENKEIIKNASFFKHLSLSFYPKTKLNTETSVGRQDQTLKTEDSRVDTMESFRKATYKRFRMESPHSNDFTGFAKSAKKTLKFNTTQAKGAKLNLILSETPREHSEVSSTGITPKNFQIRKTFMKSPRDKKPLDFIANQICAPRTKISPKAMGQSYLPVIDINDSSIGNGSDCNLTENNEKKVEKNQIAVLLAKKTQNPQMVSVAALKQDLKNKDTMKSARKISFSKLNIKGNDSTPRVSLNNRMEDSHHMNTLKQHLDVVIPEFNLQKKDSRALHSPIMMMEPLISPRKIKDQMLLIKKK